MNEDVFNNSIRKFLKTLGVTAQREIEKAVREAVAQAFRELLNNAVEWGGKLDPNRKVRISCVRAKRLLLDRIADPGEGFDLEMD